MDKSSTAQVPLPSCLLNTIIDTTYHRMGVWHVPFSLLLLSSSHSWWRWRNGGYGVDTHEVPLSYPHAFSASPRRSLYQNRLAISRDGIWPADLRFAASRPEVPAALCDYCTPLVLICAAQSTGGDSMVRPRRCTEKKI